MNDLRGVISMRWALDIAESLNGSVSLEDSAFGGAKVSVKIPPLHSPG